MAIKLTPTRLSGATSQGAFKGLWHGVGAIAAVTLFTTLTTALLAPAASAQENQPQTIPDAVESIIENRSGDYYHHLTTPSRISFITGIGGFADQRLAKDATALTAAVRELTILQTQNTPTVRVPDLPNPYTSSVQLLPASQNNSRVIGSELNFEPLPRR